MSKSIPTWLQCRYIPEENRTALQTFIYENEPSADGGEIIFREQLQLAIDEVRQEAQGLVR